MREKIYYFYIFIEINIKIYLINMKVKVLVPQSSPTLCNLMDYGPLGSSVLEDSIGKEAGVGCHALLQRIFPT